MSVNAIHPAGCDATRARHVMGISVFVDRKGFSSASLEPCAHHHAIERATEEKRGITPKMGPNDVYRRSGPMKVFCIHFFLFFFFFFFSTDK
jgi:hypothetical protein